MTDGRVTAHQSGIRNYDSSFVQWERVTAAVAAAAAGLRGEVPSNDQAEDSAGLARIPAPYRLLQRNLNGQF